MAASRGGREGAAGWHLGDGNRLHACLATPGAARAEELAKVLRKSQGQEDLDVA